MNPQKPPPPQQQTFHNQFQPMNGNTAQINGGNYQPPQNTLNSGSNNNAPFPQQQQQFQSGGQFFQQAATQLMMDPSTLQSFGQTAFASGQQYVDKNLNQWVNWRQWRYYWNVSNSYVMHKLILILFPFRHQSWTRLISRSEVTGQAEGYKPPRYDVNAPDLYIPVMAMVTYTILIGILMGTQAQFTPQVLTLTASTAMGLTLLEIVYLRLGIYLLDVNMRDQGLTLADLVAYTSYQFVSINCVQTAKLAPIQLPYWAGVAFTLYILAALFWFSLRCLRNIVFPSTDAAINSVANPKSASLRKMRVYFLVSFAVIQAIICAYLAR